MHIKVEAVDVGALDSTGQATRITAATGGTYYAGINSGSIVSTIISAITSSFDTYSSVGLDLSEVPTGVTASYGGPITGSFDRSTDRTFNYSLTFTGDTAGTYNFNVYGTVDGGRVATETDSITVGAGTVPEPGTLMLLGSGLAGLLVHRRRARMK